MTKFLGAIIGLSVAACISVSGAFAQTVEEIKTQGSISVGLLIDVPPYGILDEQGQNVGYDVDVAKLMAEDLGVELKIVPVSTPNRIPYLQANHVDLLVASLSATPERAKQVSFSKPYAGMELVVVGGVDASVAGPADLSGKSVGVVRASTMDTELQKTAPSDARIQRFDDDSTTMQALLSGQVDLISIPSIYMTQLVKVGGDRFVIKYSMREQSQSITTRLGADDLLAYVNDFLSRKIASGELNAFHEKWIGGPLPDFIANGE